MGKRYQRGNQKRNWKDRQNNGQKTEDRQNNGQKKRTNTKQYIENKRLSNSNPTKYRQIFFRFVLIPNQFTCTQIGTVRFTHYQYACTCYNYNVYI